MTTSLDRRRTQLREMYGIDFPEELFRFWQFARQLRPLEPLLALEALGVHLVGPFDVLAGRFDRHTPRLSPILHWRYYLDPPEFFTVLAGNLDGIHWGYYFDDPGVPPTCVASYFARDDSLELSRDGCNLFEAVRQELEWQYGQSLHDADEQEKGEGTIAELDRIRQELCRFATADRSQIGQEYTEKYQDAPLPRDETVTAATREGMGVVVPPQRFRPLSMKDRKLWTYLRKTKDPVAVVEEARQALGEGFPGTALKLGKDLWSIGGRQRNEYACDLMEAAYIALGREPLARVLRVHREDRGLRSVDLFEEAYGTDDNAG
jgi:hypothetical protein